MTRWVRTLVWIAFFLLFFFLVLVFGGQERIDCSPTFHEPLCPTVKEYWGEP